MPAKALPGSIEREEAARGQVDALQRAADETDDLAHQPVSTVWRAAPRRREHGFGIARRAQDDHRADLGFVQPQPQQRVVELAERAKRPGLVAGRRGTRRRSPAAASRAREIVSSHVPLRAIDHARHVLVLNRVAVDRRRQRAERDAGPDAGRSDFAAKRLRARLATASWNLLVGYTASTKRHSTARLPRTPSVSVLKSSARSRRTLRLSTTRVRPPVPGSTPSSGVSGKPDRRAAIVDQENLVARQRQLVAAAGADAVDARRGT